MGSLMTYPPFRIELLHFRLKERTHIFAPPTQPLARGVLLLAGVVLVSQAKQSGPFVAYPPSE